MILKHPFKSSQLVVDVASSNVIDDEVLYIQGADPGFSFRGGAKDYVPTRTLGARDRTLFRQGSRVQGPLKGPGSSRVVLMLSRAIWALFLSILIIKKKKTVGPILGGPGRAYCAPPPPGSATAILIVHSLREDLKLSVPCCQAACLILNDRIDLWKFNSTFSSNYSGVFLHFSFLTKDLYRLMASSRDYDELEWAWKAWRDEVGAPARADYTRYVELKNKAAQANGEYYKKK